MAASTAVAAIQPRLASPRTSAPAGSRSGTQTNSPANAGPMVQTQLPRAGEGAAASARRIGGRSAIWQTVGGEEMLT